MSEKIVLSVPGMMCGGCVSNVEKALNGQPGVVSCNVELESKTASVDADTPVAELIAAIKAAGYDAELVS